MTLTLKVDIDRVTLNDLIKLESAVKLEEIRDALAQFVVNEDGTIPSKEESINMVGALTVREMRTATDKLMESLKEMNNTAVPPTTNAN